jgi:DNA-binding response OmpR family regulator
MSAKIGEGLKILVLDDERDILAFSKDFFEKKGFKVYTALTAKAAAGIIDKTRMDIALLDIHLCKGKKSGLDVLTFIQKKRPRCQCIMVTREDNENVIAETRGKGADFLIKPLIFSKLEKVIAGAVHKIRKGA